jgi:hypothetical protein
MKKLMLAVLCLFSLSAFADQIEIFKDSSFRARRYNFSYKTVYRVNAELGRAYAQVRVRELNCGGGQDRICWSYQKDALVPGLSFDKNTEDIVFDNGSSITVCANTYIGGRIFKKRIIKPTGNCKFTTKRDIEVVDDGMNVRRYRVVKVYFETM